MSFVPPPGLDVTSYRSNNPCLIFQHYHLSRAVSVLTLPAMSAGGVGFPQLMEVVVSEFYPQQVAAYQLCMR